jgi:hypothetical protein
LWILTLSPFGEIAGLPKSITRPILLKPFSGFVFPQIAEKRGFTDGGVDGMSLLLNVKIHPSTDPSAISTVGPVMAAFHCVEFAACLVITPVAIAFFGGLSSWSKGLLRREVRNLSPAISRKDFWGFFFFVLRSFLELL